LAASFAAKANVSASLFTVSAKSVVPFALTFHNTPGLEVRRARGLAHSMRSRSSFDTGRRHGLRVSEACDLRWDDLDFTKRTIEVRRLKGSHDSRHYLERDELAGLKALQRQYAKQGIKSAYVFVNERGQPFGRMGIGRMIERAGEAAKLPFAVHVHMIRHSTGYALAAKGMDTRRLQHFLGHASITNTVRYTAMSPEPFKDVWR
jgi:site-specific recombinase XerD